MGQHITISVPTILSDWEGSNEDPERISGLGLPYCASLACPTLVHPIVVNGGQSSHLTSQQLGSIAESGPEATSTLNRREAIPDRLAYLRHKYEMQGISKRVTELLIESWRTNTNTSYNSAWRKWHSWCTRRGCDPTSTSINNVLQFLADQFDSGLQYRSINSLRSAISMTHTNISGIPIGQHPLVSRLLRGIFNIRPPLPRYSQSWNVSMVINFLSNYKSADLSVFQLAKKAVTLLALVNADRCSDLAALDRDHLRWTELGAEFTVVQLTKTRKPGPPRKVLYPKFDSNREICPVTVLHLYMEKTAGQVASLGSPKPVFVTSRKPFRRARAGTIGHWIKDLLNTAGVNTEVFSAHSTRSASTSYAASKGVPINDILKAANWSSETTFEQYYHRSSTPSTFAETILQSTLNMNRYLVLVLTCTIIS